VPDLPTLEVVPLATMQLTMAAPVRMDGTPTGTRVIVEFTESTWTGERLNARSEGHTHGDWLVVGPEGTGILDDALIYVSGPGRNDAFNFMNGAPNYFTLMFETGDERYAWLNRVVAVAKGCLDPADPLHLTFNVSQIR
jgi:hypothetical protein